MALCAVRPLSIRFRFSGLKCLRLSAVDIDEGAMYEAALRGHKERNQVRDVFGFADAGNPHLTHHCDFSLRQIASSLPGDHLQTGLEAICPDRARVDCIDLHPVLNALFCQRLG